MNMININEFESKISVCERIFPNCEINNSSLKKKGKCHYWKLNDQITKNDKNLKEKFHETKLLFVENTVLPTQYPSVFDNYYFLIECYVTR